MIPSTIGPNLVRSGTRVLIALGLAAVAGTAHGAPTFYNLGVMSGGTFSQGSAISADGTVVTGYGNWVGDESAGNRAFRWTLAGGMQCLGVPLGIPTTAGNSMNTIGTAIAGNGGNRLFRWTSAGGMQNLGLLPGGTLGLATGISGDGSTVVGWSNTTSGVDFGCRWTSATGLQSLGTLPGGGLTGSNALGISQDGTIIVGGSGWTGSGYRAYRWTSAGGMQNLGVLFGGTDSRAKAVSSNNAVIVGDSNWVGDESAGDRIFRWTSAGGMQNLGTPPGTSGSYARSVNADGKVVTGRAMVGTNSFRACVWTPQIGMVDLTNYLASLGVNMSGWTLTEAWGVSADGSAIAGTGMLGFDTRAFLVTGLPCPSTATINSQPQSITTTENSGLMVSLDVGADVPGAATYQWYVESPIALGGWDALGGSFYIAPFTDNSFAHMGANGPSLQLSGFDVGSMTTQFRFRVAITNGCGTTTSQIATVTVEPPCMADYNGDTTPDVLDFLDFMDDFGSCNGQEMPCGTYGDVDMNGDTLVDVLDFLDFMDYFGTGC